MTYLTTKYPVISLVYLLLPLTHIIITLDFLGLAPSPYKIREHSRGFKSFSCFGAKALNSIAFSIRSLSKHKFKAAIHGQLSDILLFEDDYVDTTVTSTSRF